MVIEELESRIAKFLRKGVVVAGVVIGIGWIISLTKMGDPFSGLQVYSKLSLMTQLELAFMDQDFGKMISYLGLVMLISLPLIRVVLTVYLFLKQKEFVMAGIGLAVLMGLLASFSLGIEL